MGQALGASGCIVQQALVLFRRTAAWSSARRCPSLGPVLKNRVNLPLSDQQEAVMEPGNRDSSLAATTKAPAPRGGRLDRALARASDAPQREGNRLTLLKDGPNTYDDWLV